MHIVCMKRTNVVLDEVLLEKARRASGERTYSGAITKALEEFVRKRDFWEAYRRFEEEAAKGNFFDRDYVEERFPDSARLMYRQRASADERRLPKKSATRRGTR